MKLFYVFCFLFLGSRSWAQEQYELKQIIGEYVYVASTAAAYNPLASNTKDRVLRDAKVPQGTVGYTLRVTVTERPTPPSATLLSELSKIGGPSLLAMSVVNKVATASDGNQIDVFIFNNWNQAYKFVNKQEGWLACTAYKQVISTCRTVNECLDMVTFGFRNNNGTTGLNVYFEVVAIVDVNKKNFSPEIRDRIYENCITEESMKEIAGEKTNQLCSCLADKLANDPKATTSTGSEIEDIAIEYTKTCLVDLNLVSKKDLSQELFYEDVRQIESSLGKTGVISYCEEKLENGSSENFIYNCLGWNCLITKQFTKAEYYLKTAKEKYPIDLYIQGNYANVLLLTGRHAEALEIYKRHLYENITEDQSWKSAVISDINKFKELGIVNEHFDEVLAIMK